MIFMPIERFDMILSAIDIPSRTRDVRSFSRLWTQIGGPAPEMDTETTRFVMESLEYFVDRGEV